jgi:glutathione synthase/RimK-type ligase-like ATP-grasp enzyme
MWRNRKTVLGVNARSAIYLRVNSKRSRDLADNKLETKQLLIQHGIPVAELLGVIRDPLELRQFDWEALPASFVIKPNRGFGGDGILVIFNRLKKRQLVNDSPRTTQQRRLGRTRT